MDMTWIESILYGLLSGIADILPVSAQAHKLLLMKLFGGNSYSSLLGLLIHLSILGALYYNCQAQIVRIIRARSLSKIPKRQRKRPLDTKSLMDLSLWKTMLLPVVIAFFFYEKAASLGSSLIWVATFLFLNGLLLYIPQFLPGSNKDSRMLSRVEGILMGLGGAAAVLPGISAVGASCSIGQICGVDRKYGLDMVLLMNMGVVTGLIVFDIIGIIGGGAGVLSFMIILSYLLAAVTAFCGAMLGIKIMRAMAANIGFTPFAYYCWGLALFTFILNLMT